MEIIENKLSNNNFKYIEIYKNNTYIILLYIGSTYYENTAQYRIMERDINNFSKNIVKIIKYNNDIVKKAYWFVNNFFYNGYDYYYGKLYDINFLEEFNKKCFFYLKSGLKIYKNYKVYKFKKYLKTFLIKCKLMNEIKFLPGLGIEFLNAKESFKSLI
jgi:hypothetical protein